MVLIILIRCPVFERLYFAAPNLYVTFSLLQISNEYLNRSQRIWKSIGTQYWRTKEEVVRDLVQKGEDVSNVHLKIRAIDPLDEDLNEPPPVAIMTGNNDDEGNSMVPAVMHARDVNLLHSTDLALWKSTVHEDHQMMLSVSMKDINNEESLHHHHKDESHLHKQHSDSSLSHAPSTNVSRQPSMTRQPSTVSRQPSVMSDHHHGVPATGPPKALAQAKPGEIFLHFTYSTVDFVATLVSISLISISVSIV